MDGVLEGHGFESRYVSHTHVNYFFPVPPRPLDRDEVIRKFEYKSIKNIKNIISSCIICHHVHVGLLEMIAIRQFAKNTRTKSMEEEREPSDIIEFANKFAIMFLLLIYDKICYRGFKFV